MRLLLSLWLALVLGVMSPLWGQSLGEGRGTLRFALRDSVDARPILRASVRVYSPEGSLLTYGVSDTRGEVSVVAGGADSLVFASIGYHTLSMRAGRYRTGRTHTILLPSRAIELREVTIKAPLIHRRRDTIAYNVGSFAGAGDRYLEDVLRKLPGVKVSETGAISYQGKSISRFYIEGRDLLGSNYGQATRNMPVEAISTVEVLEDHQSIRMLRGRQHSDRAAINIRLDRRYRQRPFGEVEGALGRMPEQWRARLFLTQVMGQSQALVSAKATSTGEDLSADTREQIQVSDLDVWEPQPSRLLSHRWGGEPLEEARYVRSKAYTAGANYLHGLSDDASLRVNLLLEGQDASYQHEHSAIYGGACPDASALGLATRLRRSARLALLGAQRGAPLRGDDLSLGSCLPFRLPNQAPRAQRALSALSERAGALTAQEFRLAGRRGKLQAGQALDARGLRHQSARH